MKQLKLLKALAQREVLGHAYLFSGNDREGKRSAALELVQFINCPERGCGACRTCSMIQRGIHPDLAWVTPEERGRGITIEQIRSLSARFAYAPYEGILQCALVEPAHEMTYEAQSSLLKLLEEPGRQTLFILMSEYPHALLATIRSRVQEVPFYAFPPLQEEERGIAQEKKEEFNRLASSSLAERFQYAKKRAESPEEVGETLNQWLRYTRILLLSRLRSRGADEEAKRLRALVGTLQDTGMLSRRTTVNPRLLMERALLDL